MGYYVHITEREWMIPAFVFLVTERGVRKKESSHVRRAFSAPLHIHSAAVRLNICRLFLEPTVEPFVDCHIFQLTRKSLDLVFITEFFTQSLIPLCLLSVLILGFVIWATMSLPHLSVWCPPALSPGTVGVFCLAGGAERPIRLLFLSARQEFIIVLYLLGTFCDV